VRREQLQREVIACLGQLAEYFALQGQYDQALVHARRQVELEPWLEEGHRHVMRLLALDGQRGAALAQYETCCAMLEKELGVEPGVETVGVHEAVREERLAEIVYGGKLADRSDRLPPEPGEPPFKGLQYFDTPDADLFHGREALTARLVGHIRKMVDAGVEDPESCCFLSVVGASGSGKSSVVRAGVVPALQRGEAMADGSLPPAGSPGWHIHVFTPTAYPLKAMAVSLTAADPIAATAELIDDFHRDERSLQLYAERLLAPMDLGLRGKCRLLLVVDQFEELFTLCRSEAERTAFVNNLLTAVRGGGATQVIVVLRADFYGHCAQYPLLREALCVRQEYIGPMTKVELRSAIEQPAAQTDWCFEPGLVDLILRDVGNEPGALPLLEHALLETWKRRSGRTLTLRGYTASGGVHGAIANTAEEVFASLSGEQQVLARRVFLRLTELGEGTQDTRRRAAFTELALNEAETGAVERLLKTLADARLIILSEETAEVAHEALIREWPALREWLSQDREGLRLHRHLTESAEAWAGLGRDPGELYRGARLSQVIEWTVDHEADLNALEREFLQASQVRAEADATEREAQRQRELEAAQRLARTQRQRSLVLSVGLAVAVILVAVAFWLNNVANRNLDLSVSAQQTAQSEAYNRATQEQRALLEVDKRATHEVIAVEQAAIADEARKVAENESALSRSRELAAAAVNNLNQDPQLSLLLALEAVKTAYTIEAENALHQAVQASHLEKTLTSSAEVLGFSGRILKLTYNKDGRLLAVINDQGWLQVFNVEEGELLYAKSLDEMGSDNLEFTAEDHLVIDDCCSFVILEGDTGRELMRGSTQQDTVQVVDSITSQQILEFDYIPEGRYQIEVHSTLKGLYLIKYDEPSLTYFEISVWDISAREELFSYREPRTLERYWSNLFLPVSPDGSLLAMPYNNGEIEVWELASGNLKYTLQGMSPGELSSALFSPDGAYLAVTGLDNTLKVWEMNSGKEILSLNGMAASFDPDGGKLIVTDANRQVNVWSIAGNRLLYHFLCHPFQSASALKWDGKQIAVGGTDGSINLCEISPDYEMRNFVSDFRVIDIDYAPSQSLIGIASADNTVRLYDAETGALHRSVNFPPTSQLYQLVFTPDGKRFMTLESNLLYNIDPFPMGRVWDIESGEELIRNFVGNFNYVYVEFSPDGNKFLANLNGIWHLEWDSFNLSHKSNPYWIDGVSVNSAVYSPDSNHLALAKADGRIGFFETSSQTQLKVITLESEPLTLRYHPGGQQVAVGTRSGEVFILDASTGMVQLTLPRQSAEISNLAYSPDGKILATGSKDGTVQLWSVESGREMIQLVRHESAITFLSFNKTGDQLVSGSEDGLVRFSVTTLEEIYRLAQQRLKREFSPDEIQRYYITPLPLVQHFSVSPTPSPTMKFSPNSTPLPTLATPKPLPQVQSPITAATAGQAVELSRVFTGAVYDVAWAPDGRNLAVVSTLGLSVLDVNTLEEIWRSQNKSLFISVAYSPDGQWIATGGDDGVVRIWDALDGEETVSLSGHTMSIYGGLAFSPDGSLLASASSDDTVRLWHVPDGELMGVLANDPYGKGVSSLAFTWDGAWLATGSYDGRVRLWDITSQQVFKSIHVSNWSVSSLGLSPDGVYLAKGSNYWDSSKVIRVADGSDVLELGSYYDVFSTMFSPDGSLVAVAWFQISMETWQINRGIDLWDYLSDQVVTSFEGSSSCLSFSPDGMLLAVGMFDGFVRIYGIP
jgi:WD40 repeat protein